MKKLFLAAAVAASMVAINAAHATVVVLNFAGLDGNAEEPIENYYNGGYGGLGSGPGPNYGITFPSNALACSGQPGGSCNTAEIPGGPGANVAFFLSGSSDTLDKASGFTTGFSFYYSSVFETGNVQVWSGLDSTGTLLATLTLPATPNDGDSGCFGTNFCPYEPIGVTFSGMAESVDFAGSANEIGFADITFGSATAGAVPEPASLALLGVGIAGVGLLRRRKAR